MSFYTYRDTHLRLNNKLLLANDISLSQSVSLSNNYEAGEKTSEKYISEDAVGSELTLSYYITGKDFLKDFTNQNESQPISGYLNGLYWNKGYLESYSLNGGPNSPVIVQARIRITDHITGTFVAETPIGPISDVSVVNYNDCGFVINDESEINATNVTNFTWNYAAEISPVYYQSDTGILNPDRVIVGKKTISAEITSDSEDFKQNLSGQKFAVNFLCRSPVSPSTYETYSLSGRINTKSWSVSESNFSEMNFSLTQGHLNSRPAIDNVDTSNFIDGDGYITIDSPDFAYGFLSQEEKLNLVEKVYIEDRECEFTISRGGSFDTITAYPPLDGINGTLSIHTSKGTVIYPSPLILDWPDITVSGFSSLTGGYNSTLTITGLNFFRATNVFFDEISTDRVSLWSGNVFQGLNGINKLSVVVPENAEFGQIKVLADRRLRSGQSASSFYPQPIIEDFNPKTGVVGDSIILTGTNLTSISQVYFSGAVASSIAAASDGKSVTVGVPAAGAGYPKGRISAVGFDGMRAFSYSSYFPDVPILNISAISGTAGEDFAIYCTPFGADYLSPYNDDPDNYYSVFFGAKSKYQGSGVFAGFLISGSPSDGTLTGLIPEKFALGKISLQQADGVSLYSPYSGTISEVGPAPTIKSLYPLQNLFVYSPAPAYFRRYEDANLSLFGENHKDFFGKDWYLMLSGTGGIQTYANGISSLSAQNPAFGNPDFAWKTDFSIIVTGKTGYYDVYLRNYVGTGYWQTGLIIAEPYNWSIEASTFRSWTRDKLLNGSLNDGNIYSHQGCLYGASADVSNNNFGLIYDNPIDVMAWEIINTTNIYSWEYDDRDNNYAYRIYEMLWQFEDVGGEVLYSGSAKWDTTEWVKYPNLGGPLTFLMTGIKTFKIRPSGSPTPGYDYFSLMSEMRTYGRRTPFNLL